MTDGDMDVIETTEEVEMDEDNESMESIEESNENPSVYLPGKHLEEGEELVCDESAYVMLHQAQSGAPCLSFDIIKDSLGDNRNTFPQTCYIVAGTQSGKTHVNNVIVMKLSNLHKTQENNEESDDDTDEEDEEDTLKDPKMNGVVIKHHGCVNRIRSTCINGKNLAATWSELGKVNIFDLTLQLQTVDDDSLLTRYKKENMGNAATPIYTFTGHQQEGFGLDWCQITPGVLATGDCKRNIHIWQPTESGSWQVDQRPLVGHTSSVEDLQWSPNERNVLASCSVDRSIRVWDTRVTPDSACMIKVENAHESDVNVINWNKNEPFIVSGGDDGIVNIWDLRKLVEKKPVAIFKHHTAPVTSVEWHPTDSPVFASAGADNQIVQWDLSVEQENTDDPELQGVPPQLLFIHQGQTDIKELHWHPQIPGVIISTAHSGFNIFKTISC